MTRAPVFTPTVIKIDTDDAHSTRSRAQQEGAGREAPKRERLLVISIVVLVATLVSFVAIYLLLFRKAFTIDYCNTDDCVSHANALSTALDSTVNPCVNFSAFVCGRWRESAAHKSVLDRGKWLALKNSIAELDSDLWLHRLASKFYHKCLIRESRSADNIRSLKTFMNESLNLVWPEGIPPNDDNLHPLAVMLVMAVRWDVNFLFRVEIAYNNTLSGGAVSFVRWGRLDAAWRSHLARPMSVSEYHDHIVDHLKELKTDLKGATPEELQQLEKDFTTDIYGALRRRGNQTWFEFRGLSARTSVSPDAWRTFFNEALDRRDMFEEESRIAFEDSKILDSIKRLFLQHSHVRLFIGLAWMFIQSHLWAAAGKPKLMFGDAAEEGKKIACLEFVDSRLGLLSSLQHLGRRYKTPEIRQNISTFVNRSKHVLKSLLRTASWIDTEVLDQARSKLDAMTVGILPAEEFFLPRGLEELYRNFTPINGTNFMDTWKQYSELYQKLQHHQHFRDVYSKRMSFRHEPYTYNYLLNAVDVALVGLEPPLYYLNATLAINYAAAGYRIAREMCRSFDHQGQSIDHRGAHGRWWQLVQTTEYSQRLNCDLKLTLGGNYTPDIIPAIPALEVSFAAYKFAVATDVSFKGAQDVRLRNLEAYSDDQIFFMTFCYTFCTKGEESNDDECNVLVKHSSAFAKAFQCPPDSPMNVPEKCTFFLE
ncbi:hypothetical protein HPB48_004520 [Haemaphysalis longicornis]|uniref:M13 family peptidase n=1 Tax=Haemaphysalis longicornis TaxID=44386 RepID=A0A9J6G109_HAELO|nr:hypothetical protein HPB48_004520 [Haemaphysalis longicornis]